MFTPRYQHLKLLFSFMLGVALTAILFSAILLQSSHCVGKLCSNSPTRLRRLIPAFALSNTTWRIAHSEREKSPSSNSSTSLSNDRSSTNPSTSPSTSYFTWHTAPIRKTSPQRSPSTDWLTSTSTNLSARPSTSHFTWHTAPTQKPTSPQRNPSTDRLSSSQSTGTSTTPSTSPPSHFTPTLRTKGTKSQVITVYKLKTASPLMLNGTYPPFTFPTNKYPKRTFPVPSTMPYISKLACKTAFCSEYLSPEENIHFSECYKKCKKMESKFGPIVNGTCHFMNGQGRLPVVLASFPGSGNTWMRGLLEKVTGICTGALYCDCGLRGGGFTGEGIQGPSVLVTKTHNLKVQFVNGHMFSRDRIPYGAAVLLVRNPRAALVAEWNRERTKRMVSHNVSNHYTYVKQDYFGGSNVICRLISTWREMRLPKPYMRLHTHISENKDWEAYIHFKLSRWPLQLVNLLSEVKFAQRPVHIVPFEDLKADTARELKKVTDFLGLSYSLEEVTTRLQGGFSRFYRNHTAQFSHFTTGQEQYIHDVVSTTSQFMRQKGIYELFPRIDDYL